MAELEGAVSMKHADHSDLLENKGNVVYLDVGADRPACLGAFEEADCSAYVRCVQVLPPQVHVSATNGL